MVNLEMVHNATRCEGGPGSTARAPTSTVAAQSSLEVQEVQDKMVAQKAFEAPGKQPVETTTHPRKKVKTFNRHKSQRGEGGPSPILERARHKSGLLRRSRRPAPNARDPSRNFAKPPLARAMRAIMPCECPTL
ncbi:hypothetical protein BHE74_00015513 [Ensete ventricosum]|nr:hypothetical protein BHE74_00015513 [Ensete ventricosum]